MAVRAAGPTDGAEAAAIAAAVDASACGPARLRAAAAALAGRRVAVVGTLPDAERASACGLNVAACWAPPLGVVRLGRRAFLRAVGGPRPYGTIAAVGLRAREAARMARIRVAELPLSLPDPLRPLDRRSVREDWGVADGDIVCLALGAPPSAVDARRVLDIAGRAAYLGGPVVVVAHPDSAGIGHATRFANAAGDAWRLVVDERADEPELLARAVDVAVAVRSGRGPDPDPMALEVSLRAGVPVVAAEDVPGAGALPAERRFDPRRPNVAARQLRDAASGACAPTSRADAAP